jgi:hypothetical protein
MSACNRCHGWGYINIGHHYERCPCGAKTKGVPAGAHAFWVNADSAAEEELRAPSQPNNQTAVSLADCKQSTFIGVFPLRDFGFYGPERATPDGTHRKRLLESTLPWTWFVSWEGRCVRAFFTHEEMRISGGPGAFCVPPEHWVVHDLEHVACLDCGTFERYYSRVDWLLKVVTNQQEIRKQWKQEKSKKFAERMKPRRGNTFRRRAAKSPLAQTYKRWSCSRRQESTL